MQLDLNCLLEEIQTWKHIVKKKDGEIENLQAQMKESKQHIENIDNANRILLHEIAQQNGIIASMHQSLAIVEKTEADNKALIEEIQKLKCNFKEQEKLHQTQNAELKRAIEKLEADSKKEIDSKIADIEKNVSSELEKCAITLQEKESHILALKNEILKIKQEKDQDILKIQIECEEKLSRIKNKLGKNKGIHHHDFKSNDFFRQKFMEKEREAKEESMKLKKEIDELKGEVASLKSKNTFCVPSDNSFRKEQQHYVEEYQPNKRTKLNGDDQWDDPTKGSHNDFVMHNFSDTNIKKHSSGVTPFKKKLFNLDKNYFNK